MPDSASIPVQPSASDRWTRSSQVSPGCDGHDDPAACGKVIRGTTGSVDLDTLNPDPDNGPVETLVGDHHVGPATQHEDWLAAFVAVANGSHELVGCRRMHDFRGRAAEAQRREIGQPNVLLEESHDTPG